MDDKTQPRAAHRARLETLLATAPSLTIEGLHAEIAALGWGWWIGTQGFDGPHPFPPEREVDAGVMRHEPGVTYMSDLDSHEAQHADPRAALAAAFVEALEAELDRSIYDEEDEGG